MNTHLTALLETLRVLGAAGRPFRVMPGRVDELHLRFGVVGVHVVSWRDDGTHCTVEVGWIERSFRLDEATAPTEDFRNDMANWILAMLDEFF